MSKTSLFISLCILRDLPQQKIPRELCGGEDSTIFLCSHAPMERFFDEMDQTNSKTQVGKGQIRRIQKNQEGKNGGKKKKRFLHRWRCPYSSVLHRLGTPSCDPPSGEPTRMGTSPTAENTPRSAPPMQIFSQPPKMPGPLGR
jgi:hypothetical protein